MIPQELLCMGVNHSSSAARALTIPSQPAGLRRMEEASQSHKRSPVCGARHQIRHLRKLQLAWQALLQTRHEQIQSHWFRARESAGFRAGELLCSLDWRLCPRLHFQRSLPRKKQLFPEAPIISPQLGAVSTYRPLCHLAGQDVSRLLLLHPGQSST